MILPIFQLISCFHVLQITQSNALCTNVLQIRNTFQNANSNNWVLTQRVSYLDAVEVIVNSSFQGCMDRAGLNTPCQNNFVNLYRFDTNSQRTTTEITTRGNYQPYRGNLLSSQLEQTGGGNVIVVNSFSRPNFSFTYFGIQDIGSYGDVQRLLIYYRVAQGYEEGVVTCPSIALPKEGSRIQIVACVHVNPMLLQLLVWK